MAAPRTAAISGLLKSTNAFISRACGESPGPGGFFKKSSTSLPAQKESPAPCQSTTCMRSSVAASSNTSARVAYMLEVIAFLFAGRFNSTRSMRPQTSVMISSIVHPLCLPREFRRSRDLATRHWPELCRALGYFRHGAARAEAIDFGGGEPELLENLLVVLSQRRCALRGHLGDAMHLNGAADCRGQF